MTESDARAETRGLIALTVFALSVVVAWGVFWVVPHNNYLAAVQDCTLEAQFDNTNPKLAWSICSGQVANRE